MEPPEKKIDKEDCWIMKHIQRAYSDQIGMKKVRHDEFSVTLFTILKQVSLVTARGRAEQVDRD